MKVFKKNRVLIYIAFVVITAVVITAVIISKLNTNILIGSWISEDGQRKYIFDENTLTLIYTDNGYSELYGYNLANNSVLIIQRENVKTSCNIKIQGEKIAFYSDNTDSPEILSRVFE